MMRKWVARAGAAGLMGLAWGAAWVPVGSLVGWLMVGEMEPEWIGGPLYAGFLCGAVFSAVTGIAQGRRRLEEMSVPQSGAWGALSGLLAGALWLVLVLSSNPPQWLLEGAVLLSLTLLSAVSGVGSALLARMAQQGKLRDDGADAG